MKRKTKQKPGMYLEMTGHVDIVDRQAGKKTQRTRLEDELVLQCVLVMIRQGLDNYERE